MKFICIENNRVVGMCDYRPNVPPSVKVISVNDDDYAKLANNTHIFDPASNTVIPRTESPTDTVYSNFAKQLNFLQTTDWMVLRHIRQKALGIELSLSESEYISLEQQRQAAAESLEKPSFITGK